MAVMLAITTHLPADARPLESWQYSEKSADAMETTVTIPHTWNASDIQSGKGTNQMATDGYRRAASWYQTTLPATAASKRVFVRFGAVSSVADVFLNGESIGEHRGPSTAFAFELTGKLRKDSANRLLVKADNTWREDVAPLSGDFGVPGGVYREVDLIQKDPVCLSPLYLGSRGVIVTQAEAGASHAALKAVAHVERDAAAGVALTFDLVDRAGKVVASVKRDAANGVGPTEVEAEIAIAQPHLWNGVEDPYLYTLRVSLRATDGSRDKEELHIGFRTLVFDKDKGAFLNGKPYSLRGVNRHQDREGQSWGVTDQQQREDVAIICEMGANAVRAAHYAHSDVFLDACDRAGLLVWSELSVIDTVGNQPEAFQANAESQLREMIAQQRHHACVFTWSLFNEIGHKPGADFLPVLAHLNAVARSEDPSRPTVGASNQQNNRINTITDLIAFNNYPGWYHGMNGSLDEIIGKFRATAPVKPWGVGEYGAGASLSQQDDVLPTKPVPASRWHPEAWQTRVHEQALASIQRHPELWGSFLWNMFDFASPWRHEGERDGINDKGLVTYDRKTRKDAFYLYQANWSESPVLHLLARRDNLRRNADTVVRYYANVDDVRVTLNGAALVAPELYGPRAWIIKAVRLRPGLNIVEAVGRTQDGSTLQDRIQWTMKAPATTVSAKSETAVGRVVQATGTPATKTE